MNHNGDVELAHRLVDVAADSGADAVKFQTFDPAKLVSAVARRPRTSGGWAERRTSGPCWTHSPCRTARGPSCVTTPARPGSRFLSTPFDLDSAEMLVGLGLPALKVSSGELTNLPFLRSLAALGVTMLVSTGMGDADEVSAAVEACADAPGLVLFHCVSAYPAPIEECNLRAIPAMAGAHGVPVGWSDHTPGLTTALGAVALGAVRPREALHDGPRPPGA